MKFLKKSRKRALLAKKLGNYTVYAIGEILLVVLGILIAVWIDNSNNKRIKEEQNRTIARQILAQIKSDSDQISQTLKEWYVTEQYIDSVFFHTSNQWRASSCLECANVLYGVNLPEIDRNILTTASRFHSNQSDMETGVKEVVSVYKSFFSVADYYQDITFKAINDNVLHLRDHHDWYAQFTVAGTCNTDCETYFDNSSDFLNRVAYMQFLVYDAYSFSLYELRQDMDARAKKLELLLEED
ncbi:MAG: hypothetical protein WBA16_00945 [Nonlabens sp.]